MKTRGAVIRQAPGKFEIVDLEADDPRPGEIRVRLVAAGLCHSDDHLATGDTPVAEYPFIGGHEGAGVVESVGENTPGFAVGDKVLFSVLPACGRCRWCAIGRSNLCDLGATLLIGSRWEDPTDFRMRLSDGTPAGQMCGVGVFCEHTTVSTDSVVKVPAETDLEVASLLGCGVATGWGSAVNTGGVRPGQTVIVAGIGGVGANAVQGAKHAGATTIIAVDPVSMKLEVARGLGATHAVGTLEEAADIARGVTNGQGAHVAIVTIGVNNGEVLAEAFSAISKGGTVVATALARYDAVGLPIPLAELTLYEKKITGSMFGSSNPKADLHKLLEMYNAGQLKLDELITTRYSLDDVAQGYEDMHSGKNIRGLVVF